MTGLEKIIGQIKNDSEAAAAKVLAEANAKADQILNAARKQAEEECGVISQSSTAEAADRLARAKSGAELKKRKKILAEKQILIGEIINKARVSLDYLPDTEYFGLILKMAVKFSLPQEGVILFSRRDLDRLPQGFEDTLNAAVGEKGAKLAISEETRNLDGGFVLVYGGVEENCSFTALFDSAQEVLQDKVHKLLFS